MHSTAAAGSQQENGQENGQEQDQASMRDWAAEVILPSGALVGNALVRTRSCITVGTQRFFEAASLFKRDEQAETLVSFIMYLSELSNEQDGRSFRFDFQVMDFDQVNDDMFMSMVRVYVSAATVKEARGKRRSGAGRPGYADFLSLPARCVSDNLDEDLWVPTDIWGKAGYDSVELMIKAIERCKMRSYNKKRRLNHANRAATVAPPATASEMAIAVQQIYTPAPAAPPPPPAPTASEMAIAVQQIYTPAPAAPPPPPASDAILPDTFGQTTTINVSPHEPITMATLSCPTDVTASSPMSDPKSKSKPTSTSADAEDKEEEDEKDEKDDDEEDDDEDDDPSFSPSESSTPPQKRKRSRAAEAEAAPVTIKAVAPVSAAARVSATLQHNGVSCVAFSSDGAMIATGANDKTVRIWNTSAFECIATLKGHSGSVTGVSFSPDSAMIATSSCDRTVRIWNVATHLCSTVLRGHTDRVNCVSFSPHGSMIASGSHDGNIRIWDTASASYECITTLQGHSFGVNSVSFSHDGTQIVSGSVDETIRIWHVASAACSTTLQGQMGHTAFVNCVAFSPDGSTVISASDDKTARVWGALTAVKLRHGGLVKSVAFSPDGSKIISAGSEQSIRIWNATTYKCIATLHGLQGHQDVVNQVAFSPSGLHIASCDRDDKVIIWSIGGESAAPVSKAVAPAMHAMVTNDDPNSGSGSGSGSIACIRTQARVNVLQTLTNQSSVLYAINNNLSAPHCYSGAVMEVEMEKVRMAVRLRPDADADADAFYATIAHESLLADVRDYLSKPNTPYATRQWLDSHAVNLGISTGRRREGGADRVIILLCTDPTWGSSNGDLKHFAVLSIDLHRDHASFGATSATLKIYDSYRFDPFASASSDADVPNRLDDDAIMRRWGPQVAVAMKLLGPAAEGAQLFVADVAEQDAISNDCGVHAIMFIEALVRQGNEMDQALRAINPDSVREKRKKISEWWESHDVEGRRDAPFFDYLQRGIR